MSARRVSSAQAAERERFRKYQVQHFSERGYLTKAQTHVRNRNSAVVSVLAYVSVLKARKPALSAAELNETKAFWQNARSRRGKPPPIRPRPGAIEVPAEWLKEAATPLRGYHQNEAAHCLPCSLVVHGDCISRQFASDAEAGLVAEPFGRVDDLDAIYNDADEWVERCGLRRALVESARRVVSRQPRSVQIDAALVESVYRTFWIPQASTAYRAALQEIRPKWTREWDRRCRLEEKLARHEPLDEHDLSVERHEAFYAELDEIIREYDRVTATELPLNLSAPEIEAHLAALAGANERQPRQRRRLELLPEGTRLDKVGGGS